MSVAVQCCFADELLGIATCTLKGFDLQYIRGVLFGKISTFGHLNSKTASHTPVPKKYPKSKYNTLRLIEKKKVTNMQSILPPHTQFYVGFF